MDDVISSEGFPISWKVEHRLALGGDRVEIRRYVCPEPLDLRIKGDDDALVINMALTARPAQTRVDRLEERAVPYTSEAGRTLVLIPSVPYRLKLTQGGLRSLHCAISCARFEAIAGEAVDWQALGPFSGEAQQGLGMDSHLLRIHDELIHNSIGRENVIEATLQMICVELTRRFRKGHPARPDVYTGGLAAWRMRLILDRVHGDGPAPRVIELAQLCGLTERQLGRAFKAETGMTIGRFVDEITMERAFRLLTTTNLPISAIASQLGFASAESFAQSYRRCNGMPPSKVRHR